MEHIAYAPRQVRPEGSFWQFMPGLIRQMSGAVAAVLLFLLAGTAFAGQADKVTLCHYPPDDPENPQTLIVGGDAVADHLAHGDTLGACPPSAADLDPPHVSVDPDLAPPTDLIEGIDDGPPRKLVRMNSHVGRGYQFDFVEDEIYLITKDPADLADLQSRWPATVLFQLAFPSEPGADPTLLYLLNVDPSSATINRLDKDLAGLDPRLHGQHQVSSEAGLQLLEVVASEVRRHGLQVGINVLLQSQDFASRSTQEAGLGEDESGGVLSFSYTPDGFAWPYMLHDPDFPSSDLLPLDTGVAEAFRVVQADGKLDNRVRAMITDGGFWPNDDFPPYEHIGPLRTVNPDPSGCGVGHPPALTDEHPECATHGTHVTLSGFGLPDNGFGTFGPGGPVSDLILVQSPAVDVGSVIDYIINALPDALALRPKIINVSAAVTIPGGWCFVACGPINLVSGWLFGQGIVLVAGAGNDGVDVDEPDEFCLISSCITFEAAAYIPCEADDVICVGADNFFQGIQTSYSNYGSAGDAKSVDIYAPGDVYSVNAEAADEDAAVPVGDVHLIHGTSFSTPFTAGTFALTWAANPALSPAQVRDCVLGSTRGAPYPVGRPQINVLGAVSCAMGGTAPYVAISSPADGAHFVRGLQSVELRANEDDYENDETGQPTPILWTSSLDGEVGNTASGSPLNLGPLRLSVGEHHICATVNDTTSRSWQDCVDVSITSAPPVVTMLQPSSGQTYAQSSTLQLSGTAVDPDGPTPPTIRWEITPAYEYNWTVIATTLNATVAIPDLGLATGRYDVRLTAVDATGASGSDWARIWIVPDPDNASPVITIADPAPGERFESDGGPVTINLAATVSDAEDGTIPFSQITWYASRDGGAESTLPVTTTTTCLVTIPPSLGGGCAYSVTTHTIQLAPTPGQGITQYDIKGRVYDSNGNLNESGNGRVTVFIHLFI